MGILEVLNYWNEGLDPRTKDLPLVASNYQVPFILAVYLFIVLKWGPSYMKDKKPYDLKTYIRCYNVFQVFLNGFIVIRIIQLGYFNDLRNLCMPPIYSFDPIPLQIAYALYIAWISRFVDLSEAVIFMLRKKDRQISFLHLYHHLSVIFMGWYFTRFYAVEMAAFTTVVNSFVHTVMYTYYFLSTYGDIVPRIMKKVKPFITIMQLIQFVILVLQCSLGYLPSCNQPSFVPMNIVNFNLTMYFILFLNFYRKNYVTQQKKKKNEM